MGQRTGTETLAGIVVAFWRCPVWKQADLARETGVSVRALRGHLDDLSQAGWPLEREDDPPHVYWSVPRSWMPVGVVLNVQALASLVRVLMRVPPGRERASLLAAVGSAAPRALVEALDRVIPPSASEAEEKLLPALLDGLAEDRPLRMRYFSASRGSLASRTVSVQRVLTGPPTRFVAWCHQACDLRYFRLENATSLGPDDTAAFHAVDDAEVEAFLRESVDGFHGGTRLRVAFFVRDPDARWVALNLPQGLSGTPETGGLHVEAETAALVPIARFVVGLGAAAECRSAELAALVRELAEGAIRGAEQA